MLPATVIMLSVPAITAIKTVSATEYGAGGASVAASVTFSAMPTRAFASSPSDHLKINQNQDCYSKSIFAAIYLDIFWTRLNKNIQFVANSQQISQYLGVIIGIREILFLRLKLIINSNSKVNISKCIWCVEMSTVIFNNLPVGDFIGYKG
jgi:hypothetical protein